MTAPRVLAVATMGSGSSDEARLRTLLREFGPDVFPFDPRHKRRSGRRLFAHIRRTKPRLVVMEGTGVAGGAALILARLFGTRYVVCSGDAVGPFVAGRVPWLGPVFGAYERVLCRLAAGFIGWTPYLVGRAVTFGCHRAMTAPGWVNFTPCPERREAVRRQLGIGDNELVVGLAGSLVWTRRYRYCYGLELVEAARRVTRPDVRFLIVGDGSGLAELKRRANGRVVFTGRVPPAEVPRLYAAMDVGSLPQSLDGVGLVRYTTKLPEYLAAGLGVVTGPTPAAYDLDAGWVWRVGGGHPWEPGYHAALAQLLDGLTADEVRAKRTAARADRRFDRGEQVRRVTAFVRELLAG
jgi:glycosyltransferase involved in cell wall biosynthesis